MVVDNNNKNNKNNKNNNPKPLPNPAGGDPICPDGYKLDNQFNIMDKINPEYECIIIDLKDPSDEISNKIHKMVNNPSSDVANLVKNNIPVGGKHRKKMTRRLNRNGRSHRRRRSRRTRTRRGRVR